MRDLSAKFGVTRTTVRNLTDNELHLLWYPTGWGWGTVLSARTGVRFSGNLIEALVGYPEQRASMLADIRSGKVAVTVCGADPDDYEDLASSINLGPASCDILVCLSSSSCFIDASE